VQYLPQLRSKRGKTW